MVEGVVIDVPLSEEESALLALAGWHHAGGGVYDVTGMPFPDGLARLYFRHDDGRKVTWLRSEARAEVARVRALWGQVPALLRVAREATEGEWHSRTDCRVEERDGECELCLALAALEAKD
jgi:hypothetical protein